MSLRATLAILAVPVAMYAGGRAYMGHISRNLEEGAMDCGWRNPIFNTPNSTFQSPWIRNTDIDANGKYESVVLFYGSEGEKRYHEFEITKDNALVFLRSGLVEDLL